MTPPRSRLPASTPLKLRVKYWFDADSRFVIGEGGVALLQAIDRTGSLAGAANSVGWSYRHSWGYLRRAEQAFGIALATRRAGKGAARGLDLTDAGHALLKQAARTERLLRRLTG